jgi:hypothetical protein
MAIKHLLVSDHSEQVNASDRFFTYADFNIGFV